MTVRPFLTRELLTAIRRRGIFSERCRTVVVVTVVVAGCAGVWDWQRMDRTSVAGSSAFSLAMFGAAVSLQLMGTLVYMPSVVAPMIASERDRKSLDSLLVTALSDSEIILGTIAAGLMRYLNGLLCLVPLAVVAVGFCGVDPRILLLAVAGIMTTAMLLTTLAVAVSVVARTSARAVMWSLSLSMNALFLPGMVVLIMPRLWPWAARWTSPVAVWLLDFSPLAVVLTLSGVAPRGPVLDVVLRMMVLQVAAALLLVVWSIVRLRTASRAVYDVESRAVLLRMLSGRWSQRPPCGDDPVLWHAIHPGHRGGMFTIWSSRITNLAWVGILSYVVWWFAAPALADVLRNGYGAGDSTMPESSPLIRFVVRTLLPAVPGPGFVNPRLDLNILLRQVTGCLDIILVLMVAGAAAETLVTEREKDTWLGLIATPLSGWEIIRAKMLGAIWGIRLIPLLMIAYWLVGLAAGAVHPVGFILVILELAATTWLLAAMGVSASLRSRDRGQATNRSLAPVMLITTLGALPFLMPSSASTLVAVASFPFQVFVTLFSYEDIQALSRSRIPPVDQGLGVLNVPAAWGVLATAVASMLGQVVGAWWITRSAVNDFDAVIGRPVRRRGDQPAMTRTPEIRA